MKKEKIKLSLREEKEPPIMMAIMDNAYSQWENLPNVMAISGTMYSSCEEILVKAGMTKQSHKQWLLFTGIDVIPGGYPHVEQDSCNSIKRKLNEIILSFDGEKVIEPKKKRCMPISCYDEDLLNGVANYQTPLLIWVLMANHNVHKVFVDQGSSCNIM